MLAPLDKRRQLEKRKQEKENKEEEDKKGKKQDDRGERELIQLISENK